MKLYKIEATVEVYHGTIRTAIVRARDEWEARVLVAEDAFNPDEHGDELQAAIKRVYLDPTQSACSELLADGVAECVMAEIEMSYT